MITELRLKNFKCFEKLELRVAQLTLLAGLNGLEKALESRVLGFYKWQLDTKVGYTTSDHTLWLIITPNH